MICSHPLHSQPLTAPLPTLWNIPATPQQLPPLFGTGTAAPAQLVQSVAANGNALFSVGMGGIGSDLIRTLPDQILNHILHIKFLPEILDQFSPSPTLLPF